MHNKCDHVHDKGHALRDEALEQSLKAASALCEAKNERMTASRLRTLELVLRANGPIKAYDVIDHFHGDGAAKPPTVYRALSFLEQMGLIHRIESLNAFVACSHTKDSPSSDLFHNAAFLLCQCCGKSIEVSMHNFHEIDEAAKKNGFRVSHTTLETKGLCQNCT